MSTFVLNNDLIIFKKEISQKYNLQYIFEIEGYVEISYRTNSNCGGVILKELFGIKPGSFVLITYTYNNFIFDIYYDKSLTNKKFNANTINSRNFFFKKQILKQYTFRKVIKILRQI